MPRAKRRAATGGPLVREFIERFCRVTKGDRRGELLELMPWQEALIDDLFELEPDGRRRYRQALIGMPRKNGKSAIGAAIALYLLIADGEQGGEVYSAAGDKDQAKVVFSTARMMVELEPELTKVCNVYRDAIDYKRTGSIYKALSAEAYTKEGLNPSGVVFDELHVQPNRELWDVLTLGSGARSEPLVLAITTAGYDKATICGELYDYGRRVESGEVKDRAFFFRWWEPSKTNVDWRDRKVWASCNPALGAFLRETDLEDAAAHSPENVFRRYRLNQWTSARAAWLPHGAWEACLDAGAQLDPALPLRVGIDVARYEDSSAVVAVQKQGETVVCRAKLWENPYPPSHSLHTEWRMNPYEIRLYLRELYERFRTPTTEIDGKVMPGPEFLYDPHFFSEGATELSGEGLAMVEIPQSDSRMVPASQYLYELVIQRRLAHDGDPGLARHVHNVIAEERPRGWRISKPKGSRNKIDAAVALAIAAHRTQVPVPERRLSAYESRGLITV